MPPCPSLCMDVYCPPLRMVLFPILLQCFWMADSHSVPVRRSSSIVSRAKVGNAPRIMRSMGNERARDAVTWIPQSSVQSQDCEAVASVVRAAGSKFGEAFGSEDEILARQFLFDRKGDVQDASEKLKRAVEWRRDFGPAPIPMEIYRDEEINSAKCFLHESFDKEGRPVVVVNVRNHVIGEYPQSSSQALCVATIENALQKMEDPNGQLAVIFNLNGFSLRNADFKFAKFLVQALYKYYPQRLGAAYFIDAPILFQGPWRIVKPWLRRYASLVSFVRAGDVSKLFAEPAHAPKLS
eukprot:jgi/Bigna1/86328/estExt_fgenesh1_pg.C_90315